MKIFSAILTMAGMALMLSAATPVQAGENVRYFEMGESGQVVAFPLTVKERTVAETEKQNLRSLPSRERHGLTRENVIVHEMGESGQRITFPMTAEQIARRDAASKRREVLNAAYRDLGEKRVVVFEMGESGQIITFPMTAIEIAAQAVQNQRLAGLVETGTEPQSGWQ